MTYVVRSVDCIISGLCPSDRVLKCPKCCTASELMESADNMFRSVALFQSWYIMRVLTKEVLRCFRADRMC